MNKYKIIAVGEFLLAVSAISGGYNLVARNGEGLPLSWLENTPFSSYVWPGIILMVIVGGSYLLAAKLMWKQSKWYLEASATAGFGLLIWLFTEIYLLKHSFWLQALYFVFGISTLVITLLLQKYHKAK